MKIPVPVVEAGRIKTYAKGWAKVNFNTRFDTTPAVVAVAEPKEEWFAQPKTSIYIPRISFKAALERVSVSLPDLIDKVDIPRIQRPDLRVKFGETLRDSFKEVAGDWSVLNWLRDRFADIFYWIGYAIGTVMNWFWDNVIQPQVDKVADSIKNEINNTITKVNQSLVYIANNLNYTVLPKLKESVENVINKDLQDNINTLRERVQAALNTIPEQTVERFWNAVGYMKNLMGIPVAVRNVTNTGFEVWSPGPTTIHYVAVGGYKEYEVPELPGIPKIPWPFSR